MDAGRAWALLGRARVARLGTLGGPDGASAPLVVPVCFAVEGEVAYHAVDHKPKATRRLARLSRLEADPRATLLADHYDDADWSALWWVRAEGSARILRDVREPEAARALALLATKYPQYRERPPAGPVVALDVRRLRAWAAADAEAG